MPLDQRPHIHRGNLTLAYHHAAIHYDVVRVVARAQQQRTHGVVHGTARHAEGVGAKHRDVRAIPRFDLPQLVGAAQHLGAAACGQAQGVAGCHVGRAKVTAKHGASVLHPRSFQRAAHACQQHGLACFVQQVGCVVAGAAVDA